MATVSATARNTGMMYQFAAKSISGNTSNHSMQGLIGGLSSSNLSSAWSSITGAASSGLSYATAVASNRNSLSGVLSEYDSTKKQFTKEYESAMGDLSKAAATLKNTNFNVAPEGASEDDIEKNTTAAVGAVQDFAKKYNETIAFLKDNKDVSKRVAALGNSFNDAAYFGKSLSTVGISVKSDGALSVDTQRLTKALKENPSAVENVLGKGGFTDRTANKAENAQRQSDKMFPSVSSMLGSSVSDAKRMYSANTINRSMAYENVGSMLNMYF
ncbi:MAG: flagellar filament capping protein FliD [Schwartzia sp.]|nr:flagellar filament capping protein FliD [Schwartzia sp. (in: firmicutes)]